jgi:hypothetical protein
VMAQCFSGSFAGLVHQGGNPTAPLASHDRCGFFAAPPDRPAAGCSPKSDESLYDDYTTRFFAALGGQTRRGDPAPAADLDGDGQVTFEEAHLAAIALEHTMDVPVSTSEELLRRSRPEWLVQAENDGRPMREVLAYARVPLARTAEALARSLHLRDVVTVRDLHRMVDFESDRCFPGLCEAEEALPIARARAHEALLANGGARVPRGAAALALIAMGPGKVDAMIAAAQPHFDAVLALEAGVERLRQAAEDREARLLRLARLLVLTQLEQRATKAGGPLADALARVRACETSGPWTRQLP